MHTLVHLTILDGSKYNVHLYLIPNDEVSVYWRSLLRAWCGVDVESTTFQREFAPYRRSVDSAIGASISDFYSFFDRHNSGGDCFAGPPS